VVSNLGKASTVTVKDEDGYEAAKSVKHLLRLHAHYFDKWSQIACVPVSSFSILATVFAVPNSLENRRSFRFQVEASGMISESLPQSHQFHTTKPR